MTEPAAGARSAFVSGLAWTSLVLAAASGALLAVPTAAVFLAPLAELRAALETALGTHPLPAEAELALGLVRPVLAVLLVATVGLFVVSLALLKRRAWARLCFQILLAANIVLNLAGALLPLALDAQPGAPLPAPLAFASSTLGLVFALVLSAVCAWCMWRLAAPDIKREFGAV